MNIYTRRILMLVRHLDKVEQNELIPLAITIGKQSKDGTSHEIVLPDYGAVIDMCTVFPSDWIYNNNEINILKTMPGSLPFICFREYFNLTTEEYFHCFVAYFQDLERYGGKIILHENVRPKDISFNLKALLERKI